MAAMNALCRLIKNANNALGLIFFAVMLALLNLPLFSGEFCETMIFFPQRVAVEWW